MIRFYNSQVEQFAEVCERDKLSNPADQVDTFISTDPSKISWSRSLKAYLVKRELITLEGSFTEACYRPFNKQYVYFDRFLNHERSQMPRMFPASNVKNYGFYVTGVGADKPFSVLAMDHIPDLAFWGSSNGQFFARYTYMYHGDGELNLTGESQPFTRVDNITDEALADYRSAYGAKVTKDHIFYYVYGLLHSPDYRIEFAYDLKKMLPRIPKVVTVDDFRAFVTAGQELATLHIGYETVVAYPLIATGEPPAAVTAAALYDYYRVEKMRFGGKAAAKDRSTVVYNSHITVSGIPADAHEYMLGSRSAIEWIIERYQVKTDKASGIVNDPNDWSREVGDPRYIFNLLARVITISVETVRVVRSLPTLDLA